MIIDQDYINKLSELSIEVLKDQSLSPAARILIQTLTATTQILFSDLQDAKTEIAELKERVKALEVRLSKDSHNSHLPPSSDKKRYPSKNTSKNKNSSGGQKGHKGNTLRVSQSPDEIILHKLKGRCSTCSNQLQNIKKKAPLKRQVHDLRFEVIVTEHQA